MLKWLQLTDEKKDLARFLSMTPCVPQNKRPARHFGKRVGSSDCLILLGALMTDIDFGISATPIEEKHSIYVTSEKLSIRHHNFENVRLHDFIRNLINANLKMSSI